MNSKLISYKRNPIFNLEYFLKYSHDIHMCSHDITTSSSTEGFKTQFV